MSSRNRILALAAVALAASLTWGVPAYLRARDNLVTLDVRDMEVRQVVKKIERQTWETITVHNDVQGKVTLNVRQVPLEQVLRIVGEQTSSRWSALYPLYSSSRSFAALQKALRGDAEPAAVGWTNLQWRGGSPMGAAGGMRPDGLMMMAGPGAPNTASSNRLVSLEIFQKDVPFVALALNRFAQARVVPEDGITTPVNLSVHDMKVTDAVQLLAKKADRQWTTLYTLRGERGPGGNPMRMAMRGEGGPMDEERAAQRKEREALDEELKQALPEAERQKLEDAQRERAQLRQELSNLTPEQRRERMGAMLGGGGPGGMAQRNLERIKNSTPEQRAEQRRQMNHRRAERPNGQRPPG